MRFSALLLISLCAATAFAQQAPTTIDQTPSAASNLNPFVSLASSLFDHDYFNYFAYANGVYDTYAPIEQSGHLVNNGVFGLNIGGGVNGRHVTENSAFSISYTGDYRDYSSGYFQAGTDQSLNLGYSQRLTRRLSLSMYASGGTSLYDSNLFTTAGSGQVVQANPFSSSTRYASLGVNLVYQQSRRLSYILGGGFFLQRYTFPGSVGTTGVSASGSVQYRLTARTTVGGSYSYSYFAYQRGAGNTNINSFAATFARRLPDHFFVNLYGGVSLTSSNGIVSVPVTLMINGQAVGGYIVGPYHQTASVPSFGGTLSKAYRRTLLSVSAGEGVSAGNGYYLSSRSDFVSGVFSYGLHGSAISIAGTFSRISSLANTVSTAFDSADLGASYSRTLMRHVSGNVRYDYVHYSQLAPFSGISDNRFSFGFSFSSKNVPLTLF